jgi:hypothetical protein
LRYGYRLRPTLLVTSRLINKLSIRKLFDIIVYTVVQAKFARTASADRDQMEIKMDLNRTEATFRLDSFNCRSGYPDKSGLRSRITPPEKGRAENMVALCSISRARQACLEQCCRLSTVSAK